MLIECADAIHISKSEIKLEKEGSPFHSRKLSTQQIMAPYDNSFTQWLG